MKEPHSQSPWPSRGSLTPGQMVLMLTALSVSHDEQAAPVTGSGLVSGPRRGDVNVLVMK